MRSTRCLISMLCLGVIAVMGPGCAGPVRRPARESPAPVLRITDHVGGRHERMLFREGLWYQSCGHELLVLERADGSTIARVAPGRHLGPVRRLAPITDMLIHGDRLLLVLEDDGVAELSLADPRGPVISDIIEAERLGIRPRRLSVAAGEVYISGVGGIARLSDGEIVFRREGDIGRVVTSNWGLVTTIGRRIHRLRDGEYIGSASALIPLPAGSSLPGSLAFIRRGEQRTSIGLMHGDLREVDARKATVALDSPLHRLRIFGDRMWVVAGEAIRVYEMRGDALKTAMTIPVAGARDLRIIDESHLAISGTFGRGIRRLRADATGPGGAWVHLHREPSALTRADFDGRHVLAGGAQGAWLYRLGSGARPVDEDAPTESTPQRGAVTVGATALIDDDNRRLMISTSEGEFVHAEPVGATLHCVAAVDGRFWVGHDRGITVLRGGPRDPAAVIGRLRLDGPVCFIFPLLEGGGAAWVSEFGGLGVARLDEPD
ncbi:MAG: hypothetical protein SYC29_13935 [Planctomycetota bacterium]|nr:hypothetical protein [Planctomycetota bacterium]